MGLSLFRKPKQDFVLWQKSKINHRQRSERYLRKALGQCGHPFPLLATPDLNYLLPLRSLTEFVWFPHASLDDG